MKMSVSSDKDSRKSEGEALQDGGDTCYDVCFGDSGMNEKTGVQTGDEIVWRCAEERKWIF